MLTLEGKIRSLGRAFTTSPCRFTGNATCSPSNGTRVELPCRPRACTKVVVNDVKSEHWRESAWEVLSL